MYRYLIYTYLHVASYNILSNKIIIIIIRLKYVEMSLVFIEFVILLIVLKKNANTDVIIGIVF